MSKYSVTLIGSACITLMVGTCLQLPIAHLNARALSLSSQAVRLPTQSEPVRSAVSPQRALLDRYCVTCHNERLRTAGLMLDKMDVERVGEGAEVWEKVARKLRARTMPPAGRPRPDPAASDSIAAWLESSLDGAAMANADPGRPETFHRLNRVEYQNAIRDLLGLDIAEDALPPADDAAEHGFDNMGDVLSVSPVLFDRYLSLSRTISRRAVGRPPNRPVIDTYKLPLLSVQDDRASEDLPFGSRGGIAIRHVFPVDGEYSVKIRLQTNYVNYIRGLGTQNELEVRLDGVRVKVFTVGGDAPGRRAPASYAGNIFGDPEWERYMHEADAGLEVHVPVKAGTRVVGVSFVRKLSEPEGVFQPPQIRVTLAFNEMHESDPAIADVEIGGPYTVAGPGDTVSRRKIFICRPERKPEEEACAMKILSSLARRAYRRDVTERDVETLVSFYRAGSSNGDFEAGIQLALTRLLTGPEFLFRVEREPANVAPATAYRISDFELASRLSFFLWSSIPDDQLLDVGTRTRLMEPAVLEEQVRRMLSDGRSSALVKNFAGQWLYLRNLRDVSPDPIAFPEFDENLREAFQRETELFIESQLHDDRSILDLLTANYTFLNERLARHYGIRHIYGNDFRRVTFSDDQRGGLLSQGSILTVTSYPTRTSPVLRGKWVLENILGTPPPPPPPNVADLPDRGVGGRPASVRERLEQHRKNPACAGCHAPMDPLGFALENFDLVGRWRVTDENGDPINASGVLPSGKEFTGWVGLRSFLQSNPEQFVHTVTERLLTYALGRRVEYYDQPAIRKIIRDAKASDYRWSSIILGVVKSMPFQMRRSAS